MEVTVQLCFLSELLILWHWLNWKLPYLRRILSPDKTNTATFSLPPFTWLILTAVHEAAWCHLLTLPSRRRPCTSMIGNVCGAIEASISHGNTQGVERKVNRPAALMITLNSSRSLWLSYRGEKKHTLLQWFHKKSHGRTHQTCLQLDVGTVMLWCQKEALLIWLDHGEGRSSQLLLTHCRQWELLLPVYALCSGVGSLPHSISITCHCGTTE